MQLSREAFLQGHMDVRSLKNMKMREARATPYLCISIYIYIYIHQYLYVPSLSLRWTGNKAHMYILGMGVLDRMM